jgi:hypothetical protein
MKKNSVMGTWKLVCWEVRSADGQVTYPFSQDAEGYITYTEDGYVFVVVTTANRTLYASGDLLGGTQQEKALAAETCVSYCGTYELKEDRIFHHVIVSSFPNWVGTSQERIIELTQNRLLLRTHPYLLDGKQQAASLLWERV